MHLHVKVDSGYMYLDIFCKETQLAQNRAFSQTCWRARALPSSVARTPLLLSTLQLVWLTVAGFRGRPTLNIGVFSCQASEKKERKKRKNWLLLFKPRLLAQIAACAVLFCEGSRGQTGKTLLSLIKERTVIII